jgi:hypothetical protein
VLEGGCAATSELFSLKALPLSLDNALKALAGSLVLVEEED